MVRIRFFLPDIFRKRTDCCLFGAFFVFLPTFALLKLVYGEIAKKSQGDFVKKAGFLPDGQIVFTSAGSHVILLNE